MLKNYLAAAGGKKKAYHLLFIQREWKKVETMQKNSA